MLKFLKGVVAGSVAGLKDLPYNIGDRYPSAWGSWTHFRGTSKDDGSPVSVFSLSGNSPQDGHLAAGRNGVKRLRTVRHPNILSFLHSTELEAVDGSMTKYTIYIVTEPVMPLSEKIKELGLEGTQRDEYYAWGLNQIAKAVSFLNNDCKLVHGHVCMASVVVTPTLDWKLHAFDVLSEFDGNNQAASGAMLQYEWLVGTQYKPMEWVKSDWATIRKSPPWAIDSWGLGCLIYELFSATRLGKTEELRNTASIPKSLLPDYQQLLSSMPSRRLNTSNLLENSGKNKLGDIFASEAYPESGNEDSLGKKEKNKKHKAGPICVNENKEIEKKRPSSTEGCGSIYEEGSGERKKKKTHKNNNDSDENQYNVGNEKDSGEKKKKRKPKNETDNGDLVKHKEGSPSEVALKNVDDSRKDKKKKKVKQVVAANLEQSGKGNGGDGPGFVDGEKDGINRLEDGNMGKKKKKKEHKTGPICVNKKREIEKKRPSSTDGCGSIYEEGSGERKQKKTPKNKDSDENQYDVGNEKHSGEKKKKRKRKHETDNGELMKRKGGEPSDNVLKKVDDLRKDKKKKKQKKVAAANLEQLGKGNVGDGPGFVDGEKDDINRLEDDNREKKKRKGKNIKNGESQGNGKPKKVSFSGHVEVFPSSDSISDVNECEETKLVRGKRFTEEENELVINAVHNYIEAHGLGEEGVEKVLHCSKYPEVKNCWKEIGSALPWRPYTSVYYRAHTLLERSEKQNWTPEECEFIREHVDKHGPQWKVLAEELGRHRYHVKDTWRRVKLLNKKYGGWSQDEYQKLFDLVNIDLQLKASEEKKSKHGMLRDNICWGAISDKLSTRAMPRCCMKWYNQLSSPMAAQGIWADSDDYRLLDALTELDACCIEDVDWDNLLEHRPGEVCRTRWDQMVRYIGHYAEKSFSEQVDVLANRYRPDLLEAKVAYESKPAVDMPLQ